MIASIGTAPISAGSSRTAAKVDEVDVCVTQEYTATSKGSAYPQGDDGGLCESSAEFAFAIEPACDLVVTMTCEATSNDGESSETKECGDISGELQPQCYCDSCPRELRFRYTAERCGSGLEDGKCEDEVDAVLPASARVTVSREDKRLFDDVVDLGSDVILADGDNCLPEDLSVIIRDPDDNTILQTVNLDVGCSGSPGIVLLESFGAVDFSGYTCDKDDVHNCFVDVDYDVCVEDEGTEVMTITSFELDTNGEQQDLLTSADDDDLELRPGEKFCLDTFETEIALCEEDIYEASAKVESDGPSGSTCEADTDLEVVIEVGTLFPTTSPSAMPSIQPTQEPSAIPSIQPTQEPCVVDIAVTCADESGAACDSVIESFPPETKCAQGAPLGAITLSYMGGICDDSSNQQGDMTGCEDFSSPNDFVEILCFDFEERSKEMNVNPKFVTRGQRFTVTDPTSGSSLPSKLGCSVFTDDLANELVQGIIFDTSGNVELDLKDRFGSLGVEACGQITCFQELLYSVRVNNAGDKAVEINDLELDIQSAVAGSETNDLKSRLNNGSVGAGSFEVVEYGKEYDVCTETSYSAEVVIEAEPEGDDGGICVDQDSYAFAKEIPCLPDVTLVCQGVDNEDGDFEDVDCEEIEGEKELQCSCDECARELRFRYTAGECTTEASDNFACVDNDLPIPLEGARVVVQSGTLILFDENVNSGEDAVVTDNGECLPEEFVVTILEPGTSVLKQTVNVDTRCDSRSSGIILLDSLGSLDFSGYTCESDDIHNCFVDVDFKACAENEGTVNMTITEFLLAVNGASTDLLEGVDASKLQLQPGQAYCDDAVLDELERCVAGTYDATVSSKTSAGGMEVCQDQAEITFDIDIGVVTAEPSVAPSSVPTLVPTSNIVEEVVPTIDCGPPGGPKPVFAPSECFEVPTVAPVSMIEAEPTPSYYPPAPTKPSKPTKPTGKGKGKGKGRRRRQGKGGRRRRQPRRGKGKGKGKGGRRRRDHTLDLAEFEV